MELRRIAADVHVCLQADRGLGTSNSGLVDRDGGLVVDTFWDLPHTRALIAEYASVWRAPARRVVNTHHNGDHCWGNQLFPDAEIIGQRLCVAGFGHEQPAMMEMLRHAVDHPDPATAALARKLADWDFRDIVLTPPTTIFDDRLEIDLGGLAVHLVHVGPAHTAGDTIVHLPAEGIVFTGDVLFRLCTPVGWEGTFAGWDAALARILALRPATVVPGHGPLCGVEGVQEMRAYLAYVRTEAERGFAREWTALETAQRMDIGPYAGWTEPERLVFQVERAYRELRGEPWDAPIDVTQVFRDMYTLSLTQKGRHA